MFTEASDAFRARGHRPGSTTPRRPTSPSVGRLAEILARARWLLEPSDAGAAPGTRLRPDRGGDRPAAPRRATTPRRAGERPGAALAGEIADRAATMEARLAELGRTTALRAVKVPEAPQAAAGLPAGRRRRAVRAAVRRRPAARPPRRPRCSTASRAAGDPLYNFQRLHLTRAYWLAQAIMLYAGLCEAAGPVLGRGDWVETITAAEPRLRPLRRGGGPALPAAAAARPAPRPVTREGGPESAAAVAGESERRAGTGPARTR